MVVDFAGDITWKILISSTNLRVTQARTCHPAGTCPAHYLQYLGLGWGPHRQLCSLTYLTRLVCWIWSHNTMGKNPEIRTKRQKKLLKGPDEPQWMRSGSPVAVWMCPPLLLIAGPIIQMNKISRGHLQLASPTLAWRSPAFSGNLM